MSFELQTISPADYEEMIACGRSAFMNDALRLVLWPPHLADPENPNAEQEWRLDRLRRVVEKGAVYRKIVDKENGNRIAGFAGWAPPHETEEEKDIYSKMPLPKSLNKEALDVVTKYMHDAKEKFMGKGNNNFWYLFSICVSPDYQRKGIGAILMQWGMDQADKDGLPIYLESTPAGYSLYKKMGLETIGEIKVPEFEGLNYPVMIRHPKQNGA
ncbi:uncharacterized protein K452DRAFT_291428 [Aplosporella prunicola CBS 121167]|uniref:N-acetyltransferase domain-containing protein n=1 Tax=Aplosporella prunicola CBS 121167 TaxID=1176127 RepID=A0A6A6B4C9_9PEZI|nr:uncharacterized protein K452DRAFT_291428 [Aplosporella prunicola CBS 121167]KAF2137611.1 hypothetical protein K452DRAFT_291428 [Aplosporella prunicola CBS 121167]